MKLSIFGATGSVGRMLVCQALATGHDVTALVRDLPDRAALDPRVTVVFGDAADFAIVKHVVYGCDAVLSTLGHAKGFPQDVLARAAENMVGGLSTSSGGRRLVLLSNASVQDPADDPSVGYRAARRLLSLTASAVVRDHWAQARLVEESGLEWTLVRGPLLLTNGPATGAYHAGPITRESGLRISQANLAQFMMDTATSDRYLHARPLVSDSRNR